MVLYSAMQDVGFSQFLIKIFRIKNTIEITIITIDIILPISGGSPQLLGNSPRPKELLGQRKISSLEDWLVCYSMVHLLVKNHRKPFPSIILTSLCMDIRKMHRIRKLQHLSNTWDIFALWRLQQRSARSSQRNHSTDEPRPFPLRIAVELGTLGASTVSGASLPAKTIGIVGTCPNN